MPKPTNKYDRQHLIHLQQLQQQIEEIYKAATQEAAAIGVSVNDFNPDRPFSFDDYPLTRMRIESLMLRFKAAVEVCVVNGIESEWSLANNKNNELANRVFGNNIGRLTNEQYRRYYTTNEDARDAFIQRKENGMNLSDRVWRYTNEFKDEIEMSLDIGLRGGKPADEMASDLRQYLRHPDMLFRRVRDEHGILHLSKHAAAFHPGRGVYRSSYMNARRLAATEGNIAYCTSNHERWQQMDFVVGQEVHLSNNHTCLGRDGKPHPFTDICDELAGRYPKDFKFVPWHPHCRCYSTPILKTDEEIAADTQKILNGEPLDGESVNKVKDVPQSFKDWVTNNSERIEKASSMPYFLRKNKAYMNEALGIKQPVQNQPVVVVPPVVRKSPLEIAKERHEARTKAQIRIIQDMADERTYGKRYVENVHKIEQALGMERGKRMTHEEANQGAVNPDFLKSSGYRTNCSTCSAVYILRRMGFDVEAKPNVWQNRQVHDLSYGMTTWDKWIGGRALYHPTLDWMKKNGVTSMTVASYRKFLDKYTKEVGIYEFNVGYKGAGGGHSTLLERRPDGTLVRIEQQVIRRTCTLDNLLNELMSNPPDVRGVMRIDKARFNPSFVSIVRKAKRRK